MVIVRDPVPIATDVAERVNEDAGADAVNVTVDVEPQAAVPL